MAVLLLTVVVGDARLHEHQWRVEGVVVEEVSSKKQAKSRENYA